MVYQERERLEREWEVRYQAEYGVLRREVVETLDGYLNCGILVHGAARVSCELCQHSMVVPFSCKRRGVCPSCAAKRAVVFAEHLHSEVLQPVPHHHAVFSVPKSDFAKASSGHRATNGGPRRSLRRRRAVTRLFSV